MEEDIVYLQQFGRALRQSRKDDPMFTLRNVTKEEFDQVVAKASFGHHIEYFVGTCIATKSLLDADGNVVAAEVIQRHKKLPDGSLATTYSLMEN